MVFCLKFKLVSRIYLYICFHPIISTLLFFGHEFVDIITGGSQLMSKGGTIKLLNVGLILSVILSLGILYNLHLSIQEKSLAKYTLYFASLYSLVFIGTGIFLVKHFKSERTKVDHFTIDIARFVYFWFFTFQFVIMLNFREKLRKKEETAKSRLLGFRLESFFLIHIILSLLCLPYTVIRYFKWYNSPTLHLHLTIGLKFIFLVSVVTSACFIVNSWILYKGVKQESSKLIRIHYNAKIALYFLHTMAIYTEDTTFRVNELSGRDIPVWSFFNFLLIRSLYIFELWVIVIYQHLLKRRKAFRNYETSTTTIPNVYEGIKWVNVDVDTKRMIEKAQISDWKIKFDEMHKIGGGTFANIVLGHLRVGTFSLKTIPVAVKLLKHAVGNNDEDGYTGAFVSEMKSFLLSKNHPNLVEVYGLTRCNEKPGVVMEYCSLGSLDRYIRNKANQDVILNNMESGDGHCRNELHRWALQIAYGLEFLKNINIVHGDLAARNVLLDSHKNVKITDFGMSIRLYNYQMYANSSSFSVSFKIFTKVFPWRWMAPESLSDLKFSVQSDIWGFGVTLWEIFSFGQIPWQGFAWTSDFVQIIMQGQILDKPLHASTDVYELIMRECWRVEENERMEIHEIIAYFLKDRNKIRARKSRMSRWFIPTEEQV